MVVWGSNLSSTVGRGRVTNIVKNMIKLPPYQKGVVVGLLLSDGYFSGKWDENPRLELKQSIEKSYYVFVFSIFSHYCNVYPVLTKSVRNNKAPPYYFTLEGYHAFMN